jgi:hypothetical protein
MDPKFLPEHNHSWNDLTDKPFGDIITRDPVMENVTVNCIDDGSYGRYEETYYDGDNRQFVLTAGEVYAVEWDGQTYTCQAVKGDYGAAIGNMSLYDGSGPAYGYGSMTENTGEPFAIFYQSYDSIFNHVVAKTEGEHTFTISTQTTETVRLDKKFLPDNVGGGATILYFDGGNMPNGENTYVIFCKDEGLTNPYTEAELWALKDNPIKLREVMNYGHTYIPIDEMLMDDNMPFFIIQRYQHGEGILWHCLTHRLGGGEE